MKKRITDGIAAAFFSAALMVSMAGITSQKAYAKTTELKMDATPYAFEEKSHYEISDSQPAEDISSIGEILISGNAEKDGKEGNIDKINVSDGDLEITYHFSKDDLPAEETTWHIVSDSSKIIDGEELQENIKEGAILVQTSFDGEKWINSKEQTNIFSDDSEDPVYTTSGIQLINGCYYRIIVAYKQEMKVGDNKILFVETDKKEKRKVAEVYEFYAVNKEWKEKESSNPLEEPRQEYDDKALVVNTGKDTGYAGTDVIDGKDVHYGWSIGTFSINGYTQTQKEEDGTTVFLKNVGDQVTLWFTLNQDIDQLNGKSNLVISDDKNGYDQNFQTGKTDMGRGTLIIRYTDSQNKKHDPVIYTDYLAACSTTSADTRVMLNEEGDYEVALDYEIKDTPRKVGPVEVIPEYHNYRTCFRFSVHNSNAMLFPFDIVTGSELLNRAITPNGFRIDLANSKDLDVDVTRTVIMETSSGKHIEDSRGTKAARDGAEYTKEGMYTLEVKNTYTGKETTKTIYVGSDPYLTALANTGASVKELDDMLAEGYTISENGDLAAPVKSEPESQKAPDDTPIDNQEAGTEASESKTVEETSDQVSDETASAEDTSDVPAEITTEENQNVAEDEEKQGGMTPIVPITVIVVLIVIGAVSFRKKLFGASTTADDIHKTADEVSEENDDVEGEQK